jgi:hypothetical protein
MSALIVQNKEQNKTAIGSNSLAWGSGVLEGFGYVFLDVGCYRHSEYNPVRVGEAPGGLFLDPIDPDTFESLQPPFYCSTKSDFFQALELLAN